MHTKRIIPCLDVRDGNVVKGVNFVGIKEVGDPVQLGEYYYKQGADELVFLDITATHEDRGIMEKVVERVAEKIFIPFTVGGGIRSINDKRRILRAGADKVLSIVFVDEFQEEDFPTTAIDPTLNNELTIQ